MIIEGINPGGFFKTNSNVFVTNDGYMYFQGTDQAVWRVNSADSNDCNNFGGPNVIKTQSNVFVAGDCMYFRGTDDKVWQMNTNGNGLVNLGGFKTNSNVFVATDGYMYFQGTDQAVWRVNVSQPSDHTNFGGPNVIKTQSDVFVVGGYMYFRGTDDKVWKVNPLNPNDNSNPGGFKTKSNVFVANDGYMYFRGTDDKVWKVNPLDPNDNSNPGGFKTQSDVIVAGNIMYFQGTDHLVWQYDFNDGPPQAYAHAAAEALQHWYNWKGNILGLDGRWNSTGWWNSANALNSLIDYMKITNSHSYLNAVANTFDKCKGNNFLNEYYDDEGWWALTWINAYDLTKDIHYLDMAKTIFQDMTGGWDNFFYGGIYWQKNKTDGNGNAPYKNAIANELFLTIAVRLYQRTSTSTYLDWASQEWNWFKQSGMINSKSLVNDGLDPATGWNNGVTTWTYNQGVILGGLVDLTMATQDPSYICVAQEIANAAIKTLVNANGILIELATGDPGDDRPQFKGIFIRNLAYLFGFCGQPNYSSFIQKNAQSLLQNNRDFANKFGYNWFGPVDTTDPARQTSALDALNAAMLTSGG